MNLLVIRFSAMGDVALLTPALVAIAAKYPNVQITVLTRGNYTPFFYNIPNVHVIGHNLKKYRGVLGIWKFYNEVNKLGPYDAIIDLHSSLRSIMLTVLFRVLKRIPAFKINKGRVEKTSQTRKKNKMLEKLPHTVERYLKVFEKAGFPASVRRGPWINVDPDSKVYAGSFFRSLGLKKNPRTLWIGFAPFAGHALKVWPEYKSVALLNLLQKEFNSHIFLFGSPKEVPDLERIKQGIANAHIVKGDQMSLQGEIGVMERMDIMVGMDSSNVHIAALLKVPVVGIYGTTHPFSGFGPFQQEEIGVVQVNLPCRPCSIYGNTTCYRKDFACMELIDPMDIIIRIKLVLKEKLERK
jgi:ADP-heptose:LPS heptosyltransferase